MPKSSKGYKCRFNSLWLSSEDFPEYSSWIEPNPNDIYSAKCRTYNKVIYLSNMGVQALKSHYLGKMH